MKNKYEPYLLRRTKKEIFTIKCAETSKKELEPLELPLKTDIAVFIPLSDVQKKIYRLFLDNFYKSAENSEITVNHIFPAILALKLLCVHPMLILKKVMKDGENKQGSSDPLGEFSQGEDSESENGNKET